jgi:hypothetical protein
LLVVLLFEIEATMDTRGTLSRRRLIVIKASKGVLYLSLLGAAIFWTVYGAFIDSWDAYLWILAFVMIDLNVFQFQGDAETRLAEDSAAASAA